MKNDDDNVDRDGEDGDYKEDEVDDDVDTDSVPWFLLYLIWNENGRIEQ